MIKCKMRSNNSNWNYAWKVKKDIKTYEDKYLDGKPMSKDEVIEYLFGTHTDYPETNLDLYLFEPPEKKAWHRLNMLWAVPVTLLCGIYRYIRYGDIGWNNKTKFGKFIIKATGHDK